MKITRQLNPATASLIVALSLLAAPAGRVLAQASGQPSLILHNGSVYTVDPGQPWGEAVAIEGEEIAAVGTDGEVLALAGPETRLIDLRGRMVMPGIHDTHMHVVEGGSNRDLCAMPAGRSAAFYESRMRACARRQQGQPWVKAYGPSIVDLLEFGELPIDVLDRAIPDRPAYVLGLFGHSVWVNSKALAEAGFGPDAENPRGGLLDRDPVTGRLTGLVFEAAQYLIYDAAEPPTPDNLEIAYRALLRGLRTANRHGITSVSDASGYWTRGYPEVWDRALQEGTLTVRASNALYVYPYLPVDRQVRTLTELYTNEPGSLLRFNQAKIYIDGILSLGTAATLEPYAGLAEAGRGFPYFPRRRLRRIASSLQRAGFQLHLHAIGNRGVRLALQTIEETRRGNHDRRNRITHAFLVDPQDRPRFKELGVVADFQLGPESTSVAYEDFLLEFVGRQATESLPVRSLLEAGATVVLSSDWNAEPISPFGTLERGLTRANQALPDLETAIRLMTLDAAFLLHQEDLVGSIERGKLADLIVLDRNLFEVPVRQIGETRVLMTLLAGREVYRRAGF